MDEWIIGTDYVSYGTVTNIINLSDKIVVVEFESGNAHIFEIDGWDNWVEIKLNKNK